MSQGIYDNIVPTTTSGNELATLLNDFKDAIVSGFSGTSRPSQLQEAGYWIDTTDDLSGLWYFKIYDGTQDITIFTLNKNTGLASISSADTLFEIANITETSVGPILRLLKERVSDNGQTEDGDTLGEVQFVGTRDDGVTTIQSRIKSISSDNVTSSAQGAYIAFEVSTDGAASIAEVMRIVNDKVGIGKTAPDSKLHVVGDGVRLEKNTDDAVGPKVYVKKTRIAGSGQVLNADEIGTAQFISYDNANTEIGSAQIEVKARENQTTTGHGSKITIRNKKIGQTAYSDQITIEEGVTINQNLTVVGNTVLTGTLIVNGTTITVNSTTLDVVDPNITVNKGGLQATANTNKAGLKVEMSDATHAQIGYDSTKTSKFVIGNVGSESEVATCTLAQTFTNKTLTSPSITTPSGIVKGDVGLGNVDNTSDATKNAASVTLTNKTLTAPTINNAIIATPARLDVKQDTKANLITYAASASNGQIVFATDEKLMYQVVDSALVAVGGGSSALSTIFQLDASEEISAWTSGDNATFLGGGTISGTFVKDTSTQLNGAASYKYTQAAGSLDDYISSAIQSVPLRFRGNVATCIFAYTYDGGNSDIEPVIWDVTNSAKLTTTSNLLPSTGTNASVYKVNVSIPSTCTQIRFGFQTKILNSGKILKWDDVVLSSDSTLYSDTSVITEWQSYTPTYVGFGTVTDVFHWRRVGGSVEIRGKFTCGTPTATEARVSLPNGYSAAGVTSIPSIQYAGTAFNNVPGPSSSARQYLALIEPSVAYITFGIEREASTTVAITKQNGDALAGAGTIITLTASIPIAGLLAANPQIITAPESFSSDSASLAYASSAAYTLSTLTNAPIGTFISWTYGAAGNVVTQTTTAPTQTTSDMNTNGIRLFARNYANASTAGNPSRVAINMGRGMKGCYLQFFSGTGKTGMMCLDFSYDGTLQNGISWSYNESTGILLLDSGYCWNGSGVTMAFRAVEALTFSATDGYIVINAAKSPSLVGVPQVLPRIATISEVQTSGTNGGGATSGSFQTRTLNTLVDSTGVVTSLSSNQFVLPAGEYFIEASAPAYKAGVHKIKLRNITDSTDDIIGTTEYCNTADQPQTRSHLEGRVIITSAKTFELQHRVGTTAATTGYGIAASFGVSEVYSLVKIHRIK